MSQCVRAASILNLILVLCFVNETPANAVDLLPEEIKDVRFSMTLSDFFEIRPWIKKQFFDDPERSPDLSSNIILEEYAEGLFAGSLFFFQSQRLVAVTLYGKKEVPDLLPARRRETLKKFTSSWGQPNSMDIGSLADAEGVVARWSLREFDAHLFALNPSNIRHSPTILVLIHSSARTKLLPGFKKRSVGRADKDRILGNAGLQNAD